MKLGRRNDAVLEAWSDGKARPNAGRQTCASGWMRNPLSPLVTAWDPAIGVSKTPAMDPSGRRRQRVFCETKPNERKKEGGGSLTPRRKDAKIQKSLGGFASRCQPPSPPQGSVPSGSWRRGRFCETKPNAKLLQQVQWQYLMTIWHPTYKCKTKPNARKAEGGRRSRQGAKTQTLRNSSTLPTPILRASGLRLRVFCETNPNVEDNRSPGKSHDTTKRRLASVREPCRTHALFLTRNRTN